MVTNARNIYEYITNGAFKKVAMDEVAVGGAQAATIPRDEALYP